MLVEAEVQTIHYRVGILGFELESKCVHNCILGKAWQSLYADRHHSWWIKPAAAYRDGIIHSSFHGITANEVQAYAIVMTGNEEMESAESGMMKYRAQPDDPGKTKLVRNILTQDPLRVLRTWKLESSLRPECGLRYDGL